MQVILSEEMARRAEQRNEIDKNVMALSEKIADVIASEGVTVDMAERALRYAEAIVRTRTIVSLTCL